MRIVVKNAVERKKGWLYYIDVHGNLCGYKMSINPKIPRKQDENICWKCQCKLTKLEKEEGDICNECWDTLMN